jgi:hypothetical protein
MTIANVPVVWVGCGLEVRRELIVSADFLAHIREVVARERVDGLLPVSRKNWLLPCRRFHDANRCIGQAPQLVGGSRNRYAIAFKGVPQRVLLLRGEPKVLKPQINVSLKRRQLGWNVLKLGVWGHCHPLQELHRLRPAGQAQ